MSWCRFCLTIILNDLISLIFQRFSDPESQLCSAVLHLWSLSHSNSPLHRALGRYRHTSSSRQFHSILCWLGILNYCPDGGNGNFHCSSSFLKATSLIFEAQLSFAAHQKDIISFFSLWWIIKGICAFFPSYLQWGKKVFSQPPIVQVLPLKKMREACNFHHRYTSTMRDKIRKKIQKITL